MVQLDHQNWITIIKHSPSLTIINHPFDVVSPCFTHLLSLRTPPCKSQTKGTRPSAACHGDVAIEIGCETPHFAIQKVYHMEDLDYTSVIFWIQQIQQKTWGFCGVIPLNAMSIHRFTDFAGEFVLPQSSRRRSEGIGSWGLGRPLPSA